MANWIRRTPTLFAGGQREYRSSPVGYDSGETRIIPVLISNQCGKFEKEIDVANTLLARDYKGFGNQQMNGLIECKKKTWQTK